MSSTSDEAMPEQNDCSSDRLSETTTHVSEKVDIRKIRYFGLEVWAPKVMNLLANVFKRDTEATLAYEVSALQSRLRNHPTLQKQIQELRKQKEEEARALAAKRYDDNNRRWQ